MSKDKKKNNAKNNAAKDEQAKKAQKKQKQDKAKADTAKNAAKQDKGKQDKKGGQKPGKNTGKSTEKRNVFRWFIDYLIGVRAELKRVVWPTRQKVIYLVGVVVVTLVFFAIFTAIIDYASSEAVVALDSITHDGPRGLESEFDMDADFIAPDGIIEGEVGEGENAILDFGEDLDGNGDDQQDPTEADE